MEEQAPFDANGRMSADDYEALYAGSIRACLLANLAIVKNLPKPNTPLRTRFYRHNVKICAEKPLRKAMRLIPRFDHDGLRKLWSLAQCVREEFQVEIDLRALTMEYIQTQEMFPEAYTLPDWYV